jgi:hypothetical protein
MKRKKNMKRAAIELKAMIRVVGRAAMVATTDDVYLSEKLTTRVTSEW